MHRQPVANASATPAKRSQEPRIFYPRKRALVACHVCRRKKTKCDNVRPSCGSCRELKIDCRYGDLKFDNSTYDPASIEILDQLGAMRRLLEVQNAHLLGIVSNPYQVDHISPLPPLNGLTDDHSASPSSAIASQKHYDGLYRYEPRKEAVLLSESLDFAETALGKCEDVLEWPVFQGEFHRSETETLIFNPDMARGDQSVSTWSVSCESDRSSRCSRGIQDEETLALVEKFFLNVHIKNPILNVSETMSMAKDAMEHGFKWDAPSCLVLLACALGCLSLPYRSDFVTSDLVQGPNPRCSIDDADDYPTAESYYVAALKRISLLKCSILTTQCHFLCGVYEMYSLRPLRAWNSFNRACVMFQIYLRAKDRTKAGVNESLERRLYWSCLKSECEIRMDVCLPASGLAKVMYPDAFPSPPCGSPVPRSESAADGTVGNTDAPASMLSPELENSWSYYLSEIAVRHITNRVINIFYQKNESSWLSMPIHQMIWLAQELESQLIQWYNHLPEPVATPGLPLSSLQQSEELHHMVHTRFPDILERIYRPFLYLAIHLPDGSPAQQLIGPHVEKCLEACLQHAARGSGRHRHHGTWYQNRSVFTKSLLLLAAVRSRRVNVPAGWRETVHQTTIGLRFWQKEAPDLGRAADILQKLLHNIETSRCV
ncbi:hypothetical protein C7974DRAFT_407198 [Boeremia exigua]|uniref:uncharacterized protein n=1 Tax=Boeremia exigua TaxID=749465 RepID=UPI001E8DFE1D|nr:uncharacterized protein C7974DRAFT_407198 [Boeremia exigua]KAH6611694.1 hypothetical protein C7974DRAFT_407198 [Boeremia exigua]